MDDSLDIIVKKMNNFGKKLSEKSNLYFKQAVNKSEEYADKELTFPKDCGHVFHAKIHQKNQLTPTAQ